jgi:micrococcal nuclease
MHRIHRLAVVVVLFSFAAVAQTKYPAKVVGITDGDRLTVLTADNQQASIRLAGIDAPELEQPSGPEAKKALAETLAKQVVVVVHGQAADGTVIADVYLGKTWVNAYMVSVGLAWHDTAASDDARLAAFQAKAKEKKAGLWAEGTPTPPWEWRQTATAAAEPAGAPKPAPLKHWLTTSSNKRHNSGCRYYMNSKGRMCRPTEGIACGVCGG